MIPTPRSRLRAMAATGCPRWRIPPELRRGGSHPGLAQKRVGRVTGPVEHVLRAAAIPAALAQPEAVHNSTDVVGVVADAEAGLNGFGETRRGPAVHVESHSPRAGPVDFGNEVELFRVQAAGTAGGAAFAQSLHPMTVQRAAPTGRSRTGDPELTGHLGLRKPPLQVLCG